MLGISVVLQGGAAGCWQTSISAYYFTSSHSIFVAGLCAIGVTLIVYKGSTPTEDVVLNFSGFLAYIVAMVPTSREQICGGSGLPAAYDVSPGIRNNVAAVFVAGILAEATRVYLVARESPAHPLEPLARRALYVGWILLAALGIAFVAVPARFEQWGHAVAAVSMFAGIIFVVMINVASSQLRPNAQRYVATYKAIALSMALTLVAVVVLHLVLAGFQHIIILVEALLIVEFAAFWVVQTVELWDYVDRDELIAKETAPTP
jgi:hypothetical protein